jgi:exodeoxyribonuclease III
MKLITWNCNMAFRKKAALILAQKPDILIVQECEHPDKLVFDKCIPKPTDSLWFGNNLHKGLGIFSYSNFRFSVIETHNPAFQIIIPIAVSNGLIEFNLFAIWAHNPSDPDGQYIEQIWKAIHFYEKLIKNEKTILIGDFNSNKIWDRKRREGNHSNVVKQLAELGIFSTYHHYYNQSQGAEEHPTFYLYRHQNKPYHLDYCFASNNLLTKVTSVEVGNFDTWATYSDHTPLIVTFEN